MGGKETWSSLLPKFHVDFSAIFGYTRHLWDAIDFENNTITIRHTVTTCNLDGKTVTVKKHRIKTKSSLRTLPLIPTFRKKLLTFRESQEHNRKLYGRSYNKESAAYICVDPFGNPIRPFYVTTAFPLFLEKHGLRKIRFHDLRHPYVKPTTKNKTLFLEVEKEFYFQYIPI